MTTLPGQDSTIGIFKIQIANNSEIKITRNRKDSLSRSKKQNILLKIARILWLYLALNFVLSPIFVAAIIFDKGLSESKDLIPVFFICCLFSWASLKGFVNSVYPWFLIQVDRAKGILIYRSSLLASSFFRLRQSQYTDIQNIDSVVVEVAASAGGTEMHYRGIQLFLSLQLVNGEKIHLAHLSTLVHDAKFITQLSHLQLPEKTDASDDRFPEIADDFVQTGNVLAAFLGVTCKRVMAA